MNYSFVFIKVFFMLVYKSHFLWSFPSCLQHTDLTQPWSHLCTLAARGSLGFPDASRALASRVAGTAAVQLEPDLVFLLQVG